MRCVATAVLLGATFAVPFTAHGTTWHVPSQCPTIQAGIDSAGAGDTVLVSSGTYYEHNIHMKSGVCLLSETGEASCVTIDAQEQGRIFYCGDVDGAASIEGFTITNGSAYYGGGMKCNYCSARITNCTFSGNSASFGGGIHCDYGYSTFTNCAFSGNSAEHGGGGMYATCSEPTLTRCTFSSNSGGIGGAVQCIMYAFSTFTDCSFVGNSAANSGGALWQGPYGRMRLYNCTFYGNSAPIGAGLMSDESYSNELENSIVAFSPQGDAIHCEGASTYLTCCDVYGNTGGDWVGCIQNQYGEDGNICEDPLFCDPENGCLMLQECSPCVDGYGCGQIGAYGIGCPCGGGPTGVEKMTWSSVKALFR